MRCSLISATLFIFSASPLSTLQPAPGRARALSRAAASPTAAMPASLRLAVFALTLCACAAVVPSSLSGAAAMSALQAAWASAGSAGGARGLRPFLGRVLVELEKPLRAIWEAATPAEQAAARARSVSPLAAAPPHSPLPGPYYRWIPELLGSALPSGAPASWTGGSCFAAGSATGGFAADGASYIVNLTVSGPSNASCSDIFWIASPEWFDFILVNGSEAMSAPFATSVSLPVTARPFARQWVQRKGALVMRFLDGDILTLVWEALATISLFIPAEITSPIAPADAQRVYDFLSAYANISMKPRGAVQNVTLDPALFHSGDLLLVHRPDGLGSLEQWGTGARTTSVSSTTPDFRRPFADAAPNLRCSLRSPLTGTLSCSCATPAASSMSSRASPPARTGPSTGSK